MEQSIFEELILYDVEAEDANELIRIVGAEFEKAGFVKDTYVQAVADREVDFPTGLQLATMAVAMPHTTGSHVNKPAVGIAKLKKPVTFRQMADPSATVEAELIFMMAILNPDKQVKLLQKVMGIFTNDEAMGEFAAATGKQELYEVAKKYVDA